MENKKSRYRDVLYLAIGEALAALSVAAVFLIIKRFDFKVLFGAFLGAAVAVLNFLYLSYSVNRAVDKFMSLRGEREMDEEEARAFVNANAAKVQTEVTKSYLLRTLILVLACALLFTKQFDVIAVVVPMLVQRPLIAVIEKIKGGKS